MDVYLPCTEPLSLRPVEVTPNSHCRADIRSIVRVIPRREDWIIISNLGGVDSVVLASPACSLGKVDDAHFQRTKGIKPFFLFRISQPLPRPWYRPWRDAERAAALINRCFHGLWLCEAPLGSHARSAGLTIGIFVISAPISLSPKHHWRDAIQTCCGLAPIVFKMRLDTDIQIAKERRRA
jgi:hypothetical protein